MITLALSAVAKRVDDLREGLAAAGQLDGCLIEAGHDGFSRRVRRRLRRLSVSWLPVDLRTVSGSGWSCEGGMRKRRMRGVVS